MHMSNGRLTTISRRCSRSLMQFVLQMWISTITNIVYYIQVSIVRKMKYPILLRKICSFFLLFYRTTTVSQVIFFKNFARQRNEKEPTIFGIMLVMNTATLYIYVDDLQGAINIYTNSEVFSPIRFCFCNSLNSPNKDYLKYIAQLYQSKSLITA